MSLRAPIDWSGCPLVEAVPGVQGGAAVLKGTRMPVNVIIDNFAYGVSVREFSEQFEVPLETVREDRDLR